MGYYYMFVMTNCWIKSAKIYLFSFSWVYFMATKSATTAWVIYMAHIFAPFVSHLLEVSDLLMIDWTSLIAPIPAFSHTRPDPFAWDSSSSSWENCFYTHIHRNWFRSSYNLLLLLQDYWSCGSVLYIDIYSAD